MGEGRRKKKKSVQKKCVCGGGVGRRDASKSTEQLADGVLRSVEQTVLIRFNTSRQGRREKTEGD